MSAIFEAALILAALYLPGHFLGGALLRKGDGLAELLALRLAAALAVAAPLLTAVAVAGWFVTPVITGCLALCAGAGYLLARGRERARASSWDLGTLALAVGSLVLYAARPAEYVVNSRDPGVYTLIATRLARTGELMHHDPLLRAVAAFHPLLEGKKYPGFYVYGQDLVVPQFFPAPFAFLGLGNLVGGVWGSLYVVPVMGALAVGFAYLLGAELFGRWAGVIGASLLAASYAQVWWARHPSSEVMTQLLVLSGLWLGARFLRDGGRILGILFGALLGAVMLVRVDAFLAAAAVPLLFGYDLLRRGPVRRWLYPGIPLALFAGLMVLYLNTYGARYLYVIYTEHHLDDALALWPVAVPVAAALAGAALYARGRWSARIQAHLAVWRSYYGVFIGLCAMGVALWAYFVWPVPWESLPDGSREFDAYREQVLVRLSWFVTPLVGALGLAGFVLCAARTDARRTLVLGAFLAFGALYAAVPNVAPDLPWATRRFVPVAFPVLSLLAGYAIVEAGRLFGALWDRRAGVILAGGLAAVSFGWTVYAASPVLAFQELGGGVDEFGRIEASIPEADVIFMEMPDGYDITASTFEYLYGRPVLAYDRVRFLREIDELEEAGLLRNALYVTVDGGPAPLLADVDFRQVASAELDLPRMKPVEKELPVEKESLSLRYRVFRIEEDR